MVETSSGPSADPALREAVWARVQLARNIQRPHTLELLGAMADGVVELHGDRAFGDDDALVGMVTLNEVRDVPKEEWDTTTVEQVMTRRDKIKTVSPGDDLVQAMGDLSGDEEVGTLPVVDSGKLVGLLSRGNLLRYLKLREQLGTPNARA